MSAPQDPLRRFDGKPLDGTDPVTVLADILATGRRYDGRIPLIHQEKAEYLVAELQKRGLSIRSALPAQDGPELRAAAQRFIDEYDEDSRRTSFVTVDLIRTALALPAEPQPPIDVERLRRIEEAARLVSQWHNSIGSGPIEELNAELGDLWDLTHDGEPPERRIPAAAEPADGLIAAVEALPGVMGDEAHVERDEVVALLRRAEPADGLREAWKEAEAALPEGWRIQSLSDAVTDWVVSARSPERELCPCCGALQAMHNQWVHGHGPTPAAALHALVVALRAVPA